MLVNVEGIATGSLMTKEVNIKAVADSELPRKGSVVVATKISNAGGTTILVVASSLIYFSIMVLRNILSRIISRLRGDLPRSQITFLFLCARPKKYSNAKLTRGIILYSSMMGCIICVSFFSIYSYFAFANVILYTPFYSLKSPTCHITVL